jgi:hypothetical protein
MAIPLDVLYAASRGDDMRQFMNIIAEPVCFDPGQIVECTRGDESNTLLQVGKYYTVAVVVKGGCGCCDKNGEIVKDGLILTDGHPFVWDQDRFCPIQDGVKLEAEF